MLKQHIQIGLDEPKATGFSLESLKLMSHSFDTYWPKLEESSIVAMILDPRYKLDIINNKDKKKEAKEKLGAMRKKRLLASKTQQILKHQHQRTNLQFLLLLNLKRK